MMVGTLLTKREIRCMDREELEAYASDLQIDIIGRSLTWIQQKVYEISNGIAPEEDDGDRVSFFALDESVEDEPPDTEATEEEMRRRMFSLAAETVGEDYERIDEILYWCPTLPSGERADCWLCPQHVLRPCYRKHLALVE